MINICGIIHHGGRFGEPLACALPKGHAGEHSWATLPTFTDGQTKTEKAAEALLNHIAEFDTILSQEYVDALERAHEQDIEECRARTDDKTPRRV